MSLENLFARPDCLYLIASQGSRSQSSYLETLRHLLEGGVDLLQMREKAMSGRDSFALGQEIRSLCREYAVPFIVNDDPDLAVSLGADGVHLGQDDLPPQQARIIVGDTMLIGLSTHTKVQFEQAKSLDVVSMVGFGPIFHTETKNAGPPIGLEGLADVAGDDRRFLLCAIGGINLTNVADVVNAGCRRVAVSSALLNADDPEGMAKEMKKILTHKFQP